MITLKIITRCFLLVLLLPPAANAEKSAPWIGYAMDGKRCNGGGQGFGPFDYAQRGVNPKELYAVESHHFTPNIEALLSGNTGTLEGELNYTLRAWPNHHRALFSITKYQLNIKSKMMPGKLDTPPECYFQRAIHFSPDDSVTYSLYAYYLRKMEHLDDAVKYYQKALELDPENAKFAYAFSLLLIDLKRYEEAVNYAKIAYKNGHAPDKLKLKLEKLGVWKED